jgi:hypothetical protein
MATPPPKRRRVDPAGKPELAYADGIHHSVKALPMPTLQEILQSAALAHKDVAARLCEAAVRFMRSQQTTTVDFDYLSKDVWKALNVTYGKLNGARQYDLAGEAQRVVVGCIETIRRGCATVASYETKLNAVETLRKIGKTICMSGNEIVGREIIKAFESEKILEDTMLAIVQSMTDDERGKLLKDPWCNKLWQLIVLSTDHLIMDGLGDVLAVLLEESSDEEEEAEEEEEEINDDDDDDGVGHGGSGGDKEGGGPVSGI